MSVNRLEGEEILERDSFANYRRRYRGGKLSNNTWGGRLEKIVKAIPDKLAFVQGDRRLTWKQFNERVNRLANALLDLGIKKEERIGIAGFNSIEWMESYFAISKIGAVPFNLNPQAALDEIEYVVSDADAVALIIEDSYAPTIQRVTEGIASLRHLIVYGVGKPPQNIPPRTLAHEDLVAKYPPTKPRLGYKVTNEDFCYLMYAGEMTGYPKGVVWDGEQRVKGVEQLIYNALLPLFDKYNDRKVFEALFSLFPLELLRVSFSLSHRFSFVKVWMAKFFKMIWSSTFMIKLSRRLAKEGSKHITLAPLFSEVSYMYAFGIVACVGGTTALLPTPYPFNARELLETIEKEKVNTVMITGNIFVIPILDELKKAKREGRTYDLSSCRMMMSIGMGWTPSLRKELYEFFPEAVVLDVYGNPEVSAAYGLGFTLDEKEVPDIGVTLPTKKGTFSFKLPCKVIDPEDGKEVKPGTGEIGEFVAGGHLALGYWKNPTKTESAFKVIDGRRYFFTGVHGYVDKEFRFCFAGRDEEVINVGGKKIYSGEVRRVIRSHPKVRDVAVVGVPDDELGEALAAVIELRKGEELTEHDVVEYCSQSLPQHIIPKHIMFVVSFPREATGKMEKRVLKEFVQSRLGRGSY
jgi:fatty-acyl-CoA synthase